MAFNMVCISSEFTRAINLAAQASGRAKMVPILKACYLRIESGLALVSATDTDHSITAKFACSGEGSVFLDVETILQKANLLRPGQEIKITGDDDQIVLVQGKTRWKIPTIRDTAGFPHSMIADLDGEPIQVSAPRTLDSISSAQQVVRENMPGVIGMGVFLDMEDGFRAIAGNNRGLCVIQIDAPSIGRSIVVPNNSIRTMAAIFKDAGEIGIIAHENAMTVSTDMVTYRTKLIEDKYPDWRKIRDIQTKGITKSSIVDPDQLSETIARATAIAGESSKEGAWVAVRIGFAGGEISATAKNRNGEEGVDYCPADGDEGEFAGHAEFVVTNLKAMNSEKVRIGFGDGDQVPIRIDCEPATEMDNFRLVMPMRIG